MKFSESGLAKGKESFYTELQKAGFLDLLQVYLSELLQNQEFKSKLDKLM